MHVFLEAESSEGFQQPNLLPTNLKFLLIHLSQLKGEDPSTYISRYHPNSNEDNGYTTCAIIENSKRSTAKHILYGKAPALEVTRKWSTAFTSTLLLEYPNSNSNDISHEKDKIDATLLKNKSLAKREASFKRQREESGMFKRCKTKWIPVTEFYNDSSPLEEK
eukprot:gene41459-56090_t